MKLLTISIKFEIENLDVLQLEENIVSQEIHIYCALPGCQTAKTLSTITRRESLGITLKPVGNFQKITLSKFPKLLLGLQATEEEQQQHLLSCQHKTMILSFLFPTARMKIETSHMEQTYLKGKLNQGYASVAVVTTANW